eukprot:GHVS01039374.1.p1 GENE.GHVS01039374.1~~GHVS01039374.1.p1  ORF type:complete len:448 (+),score=82.41 GHVS01039374.1:1-1344(+)
MRGVLRKGTLAQEQKGKAGVTTFGQVQLQELGEVFKNEYSASSTGIRPIQGFLSEVYSGGVYSQSSSVSRAARSGMAFMKGLFPQTGEAYEELVGPGKQEVTYDEQNIPMVMVPQVRDIWLRGWVGCEGFAFRLQQIYSSQEWTDKEEETTELREKLKNLLLAAQTSVGRPLSGEVDKSLANVFNVVDELIALRVSSHCAMVSKKVLKEGMDLVDWVERRRYGEGMEAAGGMLAQRIRQSIQYAIDGNKGGTTSEYELAEQRAFETEDFGFLQQLQVYSAHYPSMLLVLRALGVAVDDDFVPNFGSAIAFELLRYIDGATVVRVRYVHVYADVDSLTKLETASSRNLLFDGKLWSETECEGKSECPVHTFLLWSNVWSQYTVKDYCVWCYSRTVCDSVGALGATKSLSSVSRSFMTGVMCSFCIVVVFVIMMGSYGALDESRFCCLR